MTISMKPLLLAVWLALPQGAWSQPAKAPLPKTPTEQGVACVKQRRYADAKAALWTAVKAQPKDALAQAYLGLVCISYDRDPDQAMQRLEEAVRLEPQRSQFHRWLGSAYGANAQSGSLLKAAGWARKCRESFERAVALDPRDVEARTALLQFYLQAPGLLGGSVAKAKEQALAISGLDMYQGLLAEGGIAAHEKDLGQAEGLYRKAMALAPAKLAAYNSLGYLLLQAKRTDEAVAIFRKAVQVDGTDPNAHDSLAEGLLAQGQSGASLAEYRRAVEVDPYFTDSYLSLAQGYAREHDLPKAREAGEHFLALEPKGRRAEIVRKKLADLK